MNNEKAKLEIVWEHEESPDDSERLAAAFNMLLAEKDCLDFGGKDNIDSACDPINDPSTGITPKETTHSRFPAKE